MLGRRRPLLRAAAVGGGAYYLGKRRAEQEADDAAYAAEPEQAGLGDDAYRELERLGKLKDEGILTQAEFDEQKARILESA